jgi:hypothetical protein
MAALIRFCRESKTTRSSRARRLVFMQNGDVDSAIAYYEKAAARGRQPRTNCWLWRTCAKATLNGVWRIWNKRRTQTREPAPTWH